MINHINWHSVKQDGWPTKKGIYLIARGTNKPEGRMCIGYLYAIEPPEWSRCSLEGITHYIPIEDIPVPKANNGGAIMLVNSICRKSSFQPECVILFKTGDIILIDLPSSN